MQRFGIKILSQADILSLGFDLGYKEISADIKNAKHLFLWIKSKNHIHNFLIKIPEWFSKLLMDKKSDFQKDLDALSEKIFPDIESDLRKMSKLLTDKKE